MKVDQYQMMELNQQQTTAPTYFLWEQLNITLYRSPTRGDYGIAIGGGAKTSLSSHDALIHISDVVPGGPAENKLMIGDLILSVNGVNVENAEHEFVIRLLKEAKDFIHLVIKRKLPQPNPSTNVVSIESPSKLELACKRHNLAIQQTAATVMANYSNNYQNGGTAVSASPNPMSIMMNSSTSLSSMKPIKVSLTKREKKDSFGIVLGCRYYIKDILPNSAASNEPSLKKGDILIKLNDMNSEQFSLVEANKLLHKSKESKLSLVVKRSNANIEQEDSESNNQQQLEEEPPKSDIKEVTTTDSPKPICKPISSNIPNFQPIPPHSSQHMNLRSVMFARENGIGIRLAGGNRVGLFICDVQYNSPAERAGLRIGDKIIKVNGVDFLTLTREEAYQHMLTSTQTFIELLVSYSPDEYEANAYDTRGGDSFYIRAHFNYTSKNQNELSFNINDILHVSDTLHNGIIGQWTATKIGGAQEERGVIPNQVGAEKIVSNAQTIDQLYTESNNQTHSATEFGHYTNQLSSIGASARMSIRMKLAGKRQAPKQKPTSEETSHQASKPNTYQSNKYVAYERVVLKETNFVRPVVLFGPLADVAREKLKSELPSLYEIPESYSTDPNDRSNQTASGVIKLASIKAIIEKQKHCLLDITPNAVDHLNYAQYFPICIYLKAQSRNHTKELRQKYAKNLKTKSSRRLYENSMKLQNYYSHLFTGTVNLDSNQWYKNLKEIIEEQQSQPLWISQDLEKLINEQQKEQSQQQQLNNETPFQQDLDNFDVYHHQNKQRHRFNNFFNDDFELPIYTPANNLGISGAASSTYSLYEENNSYNGGMGGSINNRSSIAASDSDICSSIMNNNNNQMISANASKATDSMKFHNESQIYSTNFKQPTQISDNGHDLITNGLQKIKSDTNVNQCEEVTNSYMNHDMFDRTDGSSNRVAPNDWKKFATYSANSLRSLSNGLMIDQNGTFYQKGPMPNSAATAITASSTPTKNPTPTKVRPGLNSIECYQTETRRLSTDYNNPKRNSYSTIGYQKRPLEDGQNEETLDMKMNDLKLSGVSLLAKQHMLKQELNAKLNESAKNEETKAINGLKSMLITTNGNQSPLSGGLIKRKKDGIPVQSSPSKPPPPVLPKPKFILPQTSATQMASLRNNNLKAKSELNISTPSSSSSAVCSSSSSSTSSCSSRFNQDPKTQSEKQISQNTDVIQPNVQPILAKNKLLENNSLVSSSVGYHSDTWESSHSSRQSFEEQPHQHFRKVTSSKLACESKLAKKSFTTSGGVNNVGAVNSSDGSMNGAGSDETDEFYPHASSSKQSSINSCEKATSSTSSTVSTSSNTSSTSSTSSAAALSAATTLSSTSSVGAANFSQTILSNNDISDSTIINASALGLPITKKRASIELPIYYQPTQTNCLSPPQQEFDNETSISVLPSSQSSNRFADIYSNDIYKPHRSISSTYTAHYNDNGIYKKLSLDSNSNCSIIASANGIFDFNGGTLESADTGVCLTVPEGAIPDGCSFDLYFKVCHCKTLITNGKGELLTNPIVMCGPRGIKFQKPVELQIPHFIPLDGQSWSYAFKPVETLSEDDPYTWSVSRFRKKTLINSVTVLIDSF